VTADPTAELTPTVTADPTAELTPTVTADPTAELTPTATAVDRTIHLPIVYAYRIESNENKETIRRFLQGKLYAFSTLSHILNQICIRQYCHNNIDQYISRAIESVACIYEKHPELHSIARAI
jgi:hypothetical protein